MRHDGACGDVVNGRESMSNHRQQARITTMRIKELSHVFRIKHAESAVTADAACDGRAHIPHCFINFIAGNVHQNPLTSVRCNPLRCLNSSCGSRLQWQQQNITKYRRQITRGATNEQTPAGNSPSTLPRTWSDRNQTALPASKTSRPCNVTGSHLRLTPLTSVATNDLTAPTSSAAQISYIASHRHHRVKHAEYHLR